VNDISFPAGFRWGVATSAFQIEGASTADGRGPSIWDTFATVPGAVANGDTGDVAADHYHRWPRDIRLLADLGVDSYRFSVSWSRILPAGRGRVEQRGLDFYRRLIESLRENGIDPFVTLYHWDLPQALEDEGGWRNRDTAKWFADYAAIAHDALGDVASHWTTLNEPYCSSIVGYGEGRHAPGAKEGRGALAAAHHHLLGHGLAVRAMRANALPGHEFGIVLNQSPTVPVSDDQSDVDAARRQDCMLRRQFTEPLFGGAYPEDYEATFGVTPDFRHDDDLATIGEPLDYLGVNYYYRLHVAHAPYRDPAHRTAHDIGVDTSQLPDVPRTGMGWPVEPSGLTDALTDLQARYPDLPPVYVTENGCVYPDVVDTSGVYADEDRIAYLRDHIAAAGEAMRAGVRLRGYFCWSLLDNFEWAHGYKHRFGLIHVDYASQRRTPRASYHWYREFIAGHRA
jgi:beta-glucosidase